MNLINITMRICANEQISQQEITSILRKKHREDKNRTEWALVSKKNGKVLKWFGQQKPSEERVKKEEQRIQYFKHKNGSEEMFKHMGTVLASTFDYMSDRCTTQQSVPMDRENLDIIWNNIQCATEMLDAIEII